MRKTLFIAFFVFLGTSVGFLSSRASGATLTGTFELSSTSHTQANPVAINLSSNVHAIYNGSDAAYGIGTTNPLGTGRSYGTSSTSSYIYYNKVTEGTADPTDVAAGESTWASATWTRLGG